LKRIGDVWKDAEAFRSILEYEEVLSAAYFSGNIGNTINEWQISAGYGVRPCGWTV
jgi:hypothetical protein